MAEKTNDPKPNVIDTSKATDAETKAVLEAALNGDSLPSGFVFDPHGKAPVRKIAG